MSDDPEDLPDDIEFGDEKAEHEARLQVELVGLVVKVSEDDHPGVLLHYHGGRVVRLVANSQYTSVMPLTTETIH